MNNVINQLLEDATYEILGVKQVDHAKFAQSIVEECAKFMYDNYSHSRYEVNYMRKHMGDINWNKPIKHYDPYEIGRQLYKDGYGVSDIWGAVKKDADVEICHQGFLSEMFESRKRDTSEQ